MPQIEEIVDSDGENAENLSHAGGNALQGPSAASSFAAAAAGQRSHLEDWQEEAIATFMGIVDTTAEQAQHFLQSANWNTNQAMNLFYGDEHATRVPHISVAPTPSVAAEASPPSPGPGVQSPTGGFGSGTRTSQEDEERTSLRAAMLAEQLKQLGFQGPRVEHALRQMAGDTSDPDRARIMEKVRQLMQTGQSQQQDVGGAASGLPFLSGLFAAGRSDEDHAAFMAQQLKRLGIEGAFAEAAMGSIARDHMQSNPGLARTAEQVRQQMQAARLQAPAGQPSGGSPISGFGPSGQNASSGFGMQNPGGGVGGSRFDEASGLEISQLGAVEVKWADLPIVTRDLGRGISESGSRASPGDVVQSLGGVPIWGKSKEEIIYLEDSTYGMGLAPARSFQHGFGNLIAIQMKSSGLPIHPQSQCNNCRTMPLIGKRFHCRKCSNSVDFCGTCYAGRAHAHPSDHTFEWFEWFDSPPQPASAPPQLQQRASVVVCGSGTVWDGRPGVLKSQDWDGRWQVEFSGSQVAAMPAANLFVRPAPKPVPLPPQPPPQAATHTPGPVDCSDEGFEKSCGVPIGLLGSVVIKWCQIPVVVQDLGGTDQRIRVIESIDGVHMWGKSRKEVEDFFARSSGNSSSVNIHNIMMQWRSGLPIVMAPLRKSLRDDLTPIHPEATCSSCGMLPLVGWRYTCMQCPSFDLCGTCYAARAHSHDAGHTFVKVEYSGDTQTHAEPGMAVGSGARAVVCGTGDPKWDGREVEVQSFLNGRWQVIASRARSQTHSVAPGHLFLLSPGRIQSPPRRPPVNTAPSGGPGRLVPETLARGKSGPNPSSGTKKSCSAEGYDTNSGVPVSLLGSRLIVRWCQLPVVVEDFQEPGENCGKPVTACGDVPLWGKSRDEVERLYREKSGFTLKNAPNVMAAWYEGGLIKEHTRMELRNTPCAMHPDATCSSCSTFPLVGWRYSCTQCHSFDLCGTCYPARVHSHPASHSFLKLEFPLGPGDQKVPAEPGRVMGPKAKAVVCGTGDAMWDGREVEVLNLIGGSLWRVSACKSPEGFHSVESANLFLLSSGVPGPPPTDTFKSFLGSIQHGKPCRCPISGLEISSLRRYKVRWYQLPVIVEDPQELAVGRVVRAIRAKSGQGEKPLWGLSREQAEKLEAQCPKSTPCLVLGKLPQTKTEYENKMDKIKEIQVRVHPEVKCEGCEQEPLVGQRYSCSSTGCESTFCGACYRGRAHAHPRDHRFTMRDFPDSQEVPAEEPLSLGPGALAVVCGTRDHNLDGKEVTVLRRDPKAGWQVEVDNKTFAVLPENFFLLFGATAVEEAAAEEDNPDMLVVMLESFTGWSEEEARRLLEATNWNLEAAKELSATQELPAGGLEVTEDTTPLASTQVQEETTPADADASPAPPPLAPAHEEPTLADADASTSPPPVPAEAAPPVEAPPPLVGADGPTPPPAPLVDAVIHPDQVELFRSKDCFLGSGTFAKVYRAKLHPNQHVAAKVMDFHNATPEEKASLRKKATDEAAKMKELQHENILGFKGILLAEDEIVIFSEYCEQGSLRNVLQGVEKQELEFSDELALSTVLQAARAMQYLHREGDAQQAHRDLKSMNILMTKNFTVKVGDFGLTTFTAQFQTHSTRASTKSAALVGSTPWMAPEILKAKRRAQIKREAWLKCDVYSFACVIFEILSHKVPWDDCSAIEILTSIMKGERPDEDAPVKDCALKDLMRRCWTEEPDARPTFNEIVRDLEAMQGVSAS